MEDLFQEIKKENFFSKGKNTPFDRKKVKGRVRATIVNGRVIYKNIGAHESLVESESADHFD